MDDFPNPQPRHRYLAERIVVTGELVLTRPAHFGNGDDYGLADLPLQLDKVNAQPQSRSAAPRQLTDLPLLLNEVDGRALITGASLAGALRNHLREREYGYYKEWTKAEGELLAASLFGGHRGDPDGEQSPLIVDDALSVELGMPLIERRDGVAIDAATHTAEDKKKYDYELLAAGTCFKLHFELLLEDEDEERNYREEQDKKARKDKIETARVENSKRLQALALALQALANGEIRLGGRKRRGLGCCEVTEWAVMRYRLHQPDELLAWLATDHEDWLLKSSPKPKTGSKIAELLSEVADSLAVKPDLKKETDCREWFEVEASFGLEGSLMVRSGFENLEELEETTEKNLESVEGESIKRTKRRPDFVHLHTWARKTGDNQPVLPGTSLAGALRQRAQRIANTLSNDVEKVQQLVDGMFGPREITSDAQARASRLIINEEFVEQSRAFVQTRSKLDRFTGGPLETALLEEEPTFGGEVNLGLKLYLVPTAPAEAEIGLLLLVLKDLWLGDLPLGGEAAIGRGRLCGKSATLSRKPRGKLPVVIKLQTDGRIDPASDETAEFLEAHVRALHEWAEDKTK